MPSSTEGLRSALIVAAGRGTRAAGDRGSPAKQYAALGPRTMLAWSVEALLDHPGIDCVQVVIHPDDRALYDLAIASIPDVSSRDLLDPVAGGPTRQVSVMNGLRALATLVEPVQVLIHDAARPFLEPDVISRVVAGLDDHRAVIPALAVSDTLKRAQDDGVVAGTVSRHGLWRAQTPQGFDFASIFDAHLKAEGDDTHAFTDDASIAEAAGFPVHLVEGSEDLHKITTPEDLSRARTIQCRRTGGDGAANMETRVGQGFDVHAFEEGDAVILCGIRIPHDRRLCGHSDADVGLHALTDAILGALGDGDIGTHFPPSDEKWRDAASDRFLTDAVRRMKVRKGRLMHADVTLICEAPKIGPHRAAMVKRLSEILEIDISRVSIKATTTERLGFAGREEGIAALAVATIALPGCP